MYEHRTEPLLPRRKFLRRLAMHGLAAGGVVAVSLSLGILGYHFLAGLSWIDALLNASMILTGEGPVDPMRTATAKLFASLDRKSTRLNSSHQIISYAVFCLKKKKKKTSYDAAKRLTQVM